MDDSPPADPPSAEALRAGGRLGTGAMAMSHGCIRVAPTALDIARHVDGTGDSLRGRERVVAVFGRDTMTLNAMTRSIHGPPRGRGGPVDPVVAGVGRVRLRRRVVGAVDWAWLRADWGDPGSPSIAHRRPSVNTPSGVARQYQDAQVLGTRRHPLRPKYTMISRS